MVLQSRRQPQSPGYDIFCPGISFTGRSESSSSSYGSGMKSSLCLAGHWVRLHIQRHPGGPQDTQRLKQCIVKVNSTYIVFLSREVLAFGFCLIDI